jgi:hypothetical protein
VVIVEVVVKSCLIVYVESFQGVQVWALFLVFKICMLVSIVLKEWAC